MTRLEMIMCCGMIIFMLFLLMVFASKSPF